MGDFLYSNNASTTLAAAISNTALTFTVASGTGALFPNPTNGQHFRGTFVKNGTPGTYEIVDVVAKSTDTFTVSSGGRGAEGTTALNWAVGDYFNLFVTAAGLDSMAQGTDTQAQTGNYAADTGSANAYVVNLTPALTAHVVGMPIRFKASNANSGASTFNDGIGTGNLVLPSLAALTAGAIVAGGLYEAIWDGTQFQLGRAAYIPISLLPSPGSVVANSVARYDGSGNLFANYHVQASAQGENPVISQIMVTDGGSDNQFRKASLSYFESQLTLSSIGGQVTAAQVPVGAVTQWQASLSIAWSQLTGTKNADELQGFTSSVSAVASTIVLRDSSGFVDAVYFNQSSPNNENPPVSQVMITEGSDNYLRKSSIGSFEGQLTLSSIGGLLNASTQLSGTVPNTHLPNIGSMPGVNIAADPGTTPSGSAGQMFLYY